MKYKIITFLMLVPLVLMICVFSAAKVVSLNVPIAVTGISVTNAKVEVVDINDYSIFKVKTTILPTNATNKKLYYSTESVEGERLAKVKIEEDGTITPLTVGAVKIVVTSADGAYSDSFILNITSTVATEVEIERLESSEINVGDKIKLNATIYPKLVDNAFIVWSSSDSSVAEINAETGELTAKASGETTITARVENVGVDDGTASGAVDKDKIIYDSIKIKVLSKITDSLIVVDGKESGAQLSTVSGEVSFTMEVNATKINEVQKVFNGFVDLVWDYNTSEVESVELISEKETTANVFAINARAVLKQSFSGNASIKVRLNVAGQESKYSEFKINKIADLNDVKVDFINLKENIKVNSTNIASIQTRPADALSGLSVVCQSSDNNLVCQYKNGRIVYKANAVGQYNLSIKVLNGSVVIEEKEIVINVLNPISSLTFIDSTKTFGIENLLTVANQKWNGSAYEDYAYKLNFAEENIDYSSIRFSVDNDKIANIDNNGFLHILSGGIVQISAVSVDAEKLGVNVSANLKVRCVLGVNVASYGELRKASKDNKVIVLSSAIELGEKLIETNANGVTTLLKSREECVKILKSEVETMPTTYEWNFYKYGKNYSSAPNIYYCIKFTNDVYGNGYSLNANNITNIVDGNGNLYDFALFRGPLDFVAVNGASVKGQDNVAFLVDDNVSLNNVELIGANLNGSGVADLTKLNYVGTTVEVIGDNVSITNSRLRNGRNVLRVYGDDEDVMKKINVKVESSILSYAREFIVKLGTNAVQKGEFKSRDSYNLASGLSNSSEIWEQCAPTISGLDWFNRTDMTASEYDALVNRYKDDSTFNSLVKSELTLKNVILNTSGLFSVGLECRFAGPALDGGKWNSWDFEKEGWVNIAGTSYPTRLNIEGNFKIFDWKNIENIDSSSLIEGTVDFLKFDLREMINNIASKEEFSSLVLSSGGKDYAHGGIAMFGGGKNYCLIDTSKSNAEKLPTYAISFDELKSSKNNYMDKLKMASGKEEFRFFMYNKNSNFNLSEQEFELKQDITKYLK